MRIRRRDKGEPTPLPRTPAFDAVEQPVVPEEDFAPVGPPAVSVNRAPEVIPPVHPTPPPFDQALLSPPPASDFVAPAPAEQAVSTSSFPPYQEAGPMETPAPTPPVDLHPDPLRQVSQPVFEAEPITAPDPYPGEYAGPVQEVVVEEVVVEEVVVEEVVFEEIVVQPAELPGEPKHAREPRPAPPAPCRRPK